MGARGRTCPITDLLVRDENEINHSMRILYRNENNMGPRSRRHGPQRGLRRTRLRRRLERVNCVARGVRGTQVLVLSLLFTSG